MKQILTICGVLSFAFGGWFFIDDRKADAVDLKNVKMLAMSNQKEIKRESLNNHLRRVEQRIWYLDEQYQKTNDWAIKREIKELEADRDKTIRELEK